MAFLGILMGTAFLGGTIGGIGWEIKTLIDEKKNPFAFPDKRSSADTDMVYPTIFQLDNGDLRVKDVRRLNGLQMNVTGMDHGKATFSVAGDEEHERFVDVEGTVHHVRLDF